VYRTKNSIALVQNVDSYLSLCGIYIASKFLRNVTAEGIIWLHLVYTTISYMFASGVVNLNQNYNMSCAQLGHAVA
jgi:hypothetical protein